MGSMATVMSELSLGLPVPLELMAVTRCSYSSPSIRPEERYLVMVTGFLLTFIHLSERASLRSMI